MMKNSSLTMNIKSIYDNDNPIVAIMIRKMTIIMIMIFIVLTILI